MQPRQKPVIGKVEINIDHPKKLIDLATSYGADLIIFPELSLTGYEPRLAEEFATTPDDKRLNEFQTISDTDHIAIGVGMPIRNYAGILISMIIFQANKSKEFTVNSICTKMNIHISLKGRSKSFCT